MTLVATNGNRVVHEHPAHPDVLAILTDCEALHLRLAGAATIDQLRMTDHRGSVSCHEHTPEITVAPHSRR